MTLTQDKASVELTAKQAENRAEQDRQTLLKAAADKGGMLQATIDPGPSLKPNPTPG